MTISLASRGFESEGKGNTEWQQWSEAEKEDIAIIMEKYGIGWKKLDTHKPHLSVLDYKKQERSREVKELEQELEDISVVIELKEERESRLDREINKQELQLKKDCEEAEKTLSIVNSLKEKALDEGAMQERRNKTLIADNLELAAVITDKKEQLADLQAALERAHAVFETANEELERAKEELAEVRKLRSELIAYGDGDYYLKEEVIRLRYENPNLMIEGKSMLDKFLEWIGEKVRDVRGR